MATFTNSVEANYADELRAKRDCPDEQIARGFLISNPKALAKAVREERKGDTLTRRHWLLQAATQALSGACMDAEEAGHIGLDGAQMSITIEDLTATAVLTLPEEG